VRAESASDLDCADRSILFTRTRVWAEPADSGNTRTGLTWMPTRRDGQLREFGIVQLNTQATRPLRLSTPPENTATVCCFLCQSLWFEPALEAVAVAGQIDDFGAVDDPIDHG